MHHQFLQSFYNWGHLMSAPDSFSFAKSDLDSGKGRVVPFLAAAAE
jgi:hypothetical protein